MLECHARTKCTAQGAKAQSTHQTHASPSSTCAYSVEGEGMRRGHVINDLNGRQEGERTERAKVVRKDMG